MLSEGSAVLLSRHGASLASKPESFGFGRTFTDMTACPLTGHADEPALEMRRRYLEMELQAKDIAPVSESLVRASFGVGQIYSPGRKIEGVAVPVQNRPVLGKHGKARTHSLWRELYRRKADLLDIHRVNPCTKRAGD
jgi:hypothetical protein